MDLDVRAVLLRCGTGVFLQTLLPSEADMMVQAPLSSVLRVGTLEVSWPSYGLKWSGCCGEGGQPASWWVFPKWSQLPWLSHGA